MSRLIRIYTFLAFCFSVYTETPIFNNGPLQIQRWKRPLQEVSGERVNLPLPRHHHPTQYLFYVDRSKAILLLEFFFFFFFVSISLLHLFRCVLSLSFLISSSLQYIRKAGFVTVTYPEKLLLYIQSTLLISKSKGPSLVGISPDKGR